jgi:hypothetical protein
MKTTHLADETEDAKPFKDFTTLWFDGDGLLRHRRRFLFGGSEPVVAHPDKNLNINWESVGYETHRV